MGYNVGQTPDAIVSSALTIAQGGVNDIKAVLDDVQDSTLSLNAQKVDVNGNVTKEQSVANKYGALASDTPANISTAAGAMVVDDLMQKISTKVQVAAQLLSAANNINKTVGRTLSQG